MDVIQSREFVSMAHQRLTGEELRATMSAVTTYWENPSHPGLNLHRVEGPDPDMWSIRATRDIRIIIHKSESRTPSAVALLMQGWGGV